MLFSKLTRQQNARCVFCFLTFSASFAFALLITATSVVKADTVYPSGACRIQATLGTCIDSTPCKPDSSGVLVCLSGVALPAGGEPTATNPLGALSVPQSCWQNEYEYACISGGALANNALQDQAAQGNGCVQEQSNPLCSLLSSVCSSQMAGTTNAVCMQYQQTYSCATPASKPIQPAVCSDSSWLKSMALVPTAATAVASTNSFVLASTAMEIASEIQTYANCSADNPLACAKAVLFAGTPENCSKGWLGLKNCCVAKPGAQPNSAMLGLLLGPLASVVKYAGQNAVDSASPFVFDAMYSSGAYTQGMISALTQSSSVITDSEGFANTTIFGASGLSMGAYGFTWGLGAAPASTGVLGGTTELSALSSSTGGYYVTFNPYVFAATIALTAVQSLESCSAAEQLLAVHRGADLSVYTSEQCTQTLPLTKSCTLYQDNYCSFNGVLGKIINQQGKKQLGLNFSDCTGMRIEQILTLNFSAMDFTEFSTQLTQQAQRNIPQNMNSNYLPIESSRTSGSHQSTANGLAYPNH